MKGYLKDLVEMKIIEMKEFREIKNDLHPILFDFC